MAWRRNSRAAARRILTLAACCCLLVAGCGDDGGAAYKARLLGAWVSDHPRYAGCEMTISLDRMIFETGSGTLMTNAIDDIHYQNDKGAHLLRMEMMDGGEPAFTMSFYLESDAHGDRLRFKNQPDVIWRHTGRL